MVHRAQLAAHGRFRHGYAELFEQPLAKVDDPPARDAMDCRASGRPRRRGRARRDVRPSRATAVPELYHRHDHSDRRRRKRACDDNHPFHVIVAHSPPCFSRDAFHLELHLRKLARADVNVVSITPALGDDPARVMMRQIIAMSNEHRSRENAKHGEHWLRRCCLREGLYSITGRPDRGRRRTDPNFWGRKACGNSALPDEPSRPPVFAVLHASGAPKGRGSPPRRLLKNQ